MQVILRLMETKFSKIYSHEISINMFDINENLDIISKLSNILDKTH